MAMLGRTAQSGGGGGGGGDGDGDRDFTEFICPVCLEIFDSPMITKCGHTFCNRCLQECLRPKKPVCAVCRASLDKWDKAVELEAAIQTTRKSCKGCGQKIVLSEMRSHIGSCSNYQDYIQEGLKNILHTTQSDVVSSVPNRFTFTCPYCNCPNLDQDGLVEHCNSQHSHDPRPVVCPICASMPWGDPTYKSSDFFQHLRIRHTFSYDTFVDYAADEDAMIQQAIQRSLADN